VTLMACTGQPSPEVSAGDAQNGQSVKVHTGDVLRVTLDKTAWTFAPSSDPSVLEQQGDQVVAPTGGCFPGMGCGTTTARYKALKPGTTIVNASRLSCGEARRCVGAEGIYQLTVVVS
jgi:hypothetical protein